MIYPIVLYGAKVLREPTRKLSKEELKSPELKEFINNLFETMYSASGVGLSAPQVGYALSVFVVDGSQIYDPEENPEPDLKDLIDAFINPEIIEYKQPIIKMKEGCLSFPDLRIEIPRYQKIKIKYYNKEGELVIKEFSDYAARILQHEYDHLQGKLFIDYVKGIKRKFINSKLKKIIKGKVDTSYKVITKDKAPFHSALLNTISSH